MRVLLAEDDELIGKGIVAGLYKNGITVHHVCTAYEAESAQQSNTFHALVLDLGLPDRDGRWIRACPCSYFRHVMPLNTGSRAYRAGQMTT